jgi:hypothetical protein
MAKKIVVRVLVDCAVGKADDVVEIDASAAKVMAEAGEVDVHPDAVAWARTLPQNASQ